MVTGELKASVDRIWDAFWSGGIANPLEVMEQITYLLFIRRLDDLQTAKENRANRLGAAIEARRRPRAAGAPPVPPDVLGPVIRVIVLTAAMTGLRQSELLGLRWRDADWTA